MLVPRSPNYSGEYEPVSREWISKDQVDGPEKTGLRKRMVERKDRKEFLHTGRCSGLGEGREWNRVGAEPSYSSSSANGEDGGSGEEAGVRCGGAVCAAKGAALCLSIIGESLVIGRGARRGGGDGVRGKTRLRRDGEMTRERRAVGCCCCVSAAGCVQTFGSTGRDELKRGCARRARSAAATSSRVVGDFAWLDGWGLLYLERGAAREDGKARKKVSCTGEETMSICGSSESRGAREGAREQPEERASSLIRAGSCSKSSSLSSHFGGGRAERGGGMCVIGDHIHVESRGGGGGGREEGGGECNGKSVGEGRRRSKSRFNVD
ncbi:hypothetical protein EDB85DRAFT_858565 [Lactarius pseudohatsudake]|nr:hypothetical protein EDB85DRAFT_858565 [Lactarius pseudohatsudake]